MKTLLLSQPNSTSFQARNARFLTLTVFSLLLFSGSGFAQLFVQSFNGGNPISKYVAASPGNEKFTAPGVPGGAFVSAATPALAYCQEYNQVRLSISISPPVS